MAMTLRLTDDESAALRTYAQTSGRSMQDVAREAIRDYLAERTKRRDEILARIVTEDAELLNLLSK
ncbi:MAG: DNA-binding protein [Pseudonocardiales bacterium]|nr:MAG: DNA-binding protein [Pseudonocardiales bacterium]